MTNITMNTTSMTFQLATYIKARELLVHYKLASVLDIGSGDGKKLQAFIYPFTKDITVFDLPSGLARLKHKFNKIISGDLNRGYFDFERKFDLIISADCIEHILLYQNLIETLKRNSTKDTYIVLSSPDCSTVMRQRSDHKHNWTQSEFEQVLNYFGVTILSCDLVDELDAYPVYKSIIAVCKV